MPVKVSSSGPDVDVVPINVPGALERVCEESTKILASLIQEDLLASARGAVITEQARKRIPELRNFALLLEKYLKCFSIAPIEQGFKLEVDRKKLQEQGLPAELPELLEYGSEIGISPMIHLRTAWMRFVRDVVPKLAGKVLNELSVR